MALTYHATTSQSDAPCRKRRACSRSPSFNLPFPFIGEELGVAELDDAFRTPVQSDAPTLFCAGTLDGRTPISNAEAALGGFPNGQPIVVEGMGHDEPGLLLDAQVGFLEVRDVAVERLVLPFAFDAMR